MTRAVDRLHALPLEEFVPARDALAKRLRSEGDREGAAEVAKLRRPAIHAWVANRLWWDFRAPFERLLRAGRALRGEGKVADPIGQERDALRELLAEARRILADAGRPTDPWLERVRTLLLALASGAGEPGRLAGDLEEPAPEAMFAASLPRKRRPARPRAPEPEPIRTEAEEAELAEAEAAARAAQERLERARRQLASARRR